MGYLTSPSNPTDAVAYISDYNCPGAKRQVITAIAQKMPPLEGPGAGEVLTAIWLPEEIARTFIAFDHESSVLDSTVVRPCSKTAAPALLSSIEASNFYRLSLRDLHAVKFAAFSKTK